MKIFLGSDHAGYELKEKIKIWLEEWGYEHEDMGPFAFDAKDDYPDFIKPVAEAVADDPENNRGIILGFNGQGEAVAANRYKGVRAAVYYGEPTDISESGREREDKPKNMLILSREDDDTNILSLAAGFIADDTAEEAIKLWLETPFTGEERHKRRINKI
ncbi:MAG: hypothetical protein A2919_01545, partial [Candidatus Spechtbacteria bacterium RIFCSPLOWO2_01_FULL_43_12]